MAKDIHENAKGFDDKYQSNAQRHTKKLDAVPHALQLGETITFITDLTLDGAIRADIAIATTSRFLIVRNNGKRIDTIGLSDITSITLDDPTATGNLLTLTLHTGEWKARISSRPAALALIQQLQGTDAAPHAEQGFAAPHSTYDLPNHDHPASTTPSSLPSQQEHTIAPDIPTIPGELRQQIEEFDRRFGMDLRSHTATHPAITEALEPSEKVVFICEGTLRKASTTYILVVTNRRLMVIDTDGTLLEEHPLDWITQLAIADPKRIRAYTAPPPLELTIGTATWTWTAKTLHSAIVAAHAILLGTNAYTPGTTLHPVTIIPPPSFKTLNDTQIALPFLRGSYTLTDETVRTPAEFVPFKTSLLREEALLGFWELADVDSHPHTFAISSRHLFHFDRTDDSTTRLLPVAEGPPSIQKFPLMAVHNVSVNHGEGNAPATLVFEAAGVVHSLSVDWQYGGFLDEFVTDLQFAATYARSDESTGSCPSDPFYWPAQALDLLVAASETYPSPDPTIPNPAFSADDEPADYRIQDMPVGERNNLLNRFALAYGLDLSSLSSAVDELTTLMGSAEWLVCLTQTRRPGGESPDLLALTNEWLYIIGNDGGDYAPFPLGVIGNVSGEAGRTTGAISFSDPDGLYTLDSVPTASIDPFVTAALMFLPAAKARLEVKQQLEREGLVAHAIMGPDDVYDAQTDGMPDDDVAVSQILSRVVHGIPYDVALEIYGHLENEIHGFKQFTKWQLEELPRSLLPNESLLWLAQGFLQGSWKDPGDAGRAMIAVTDFRLLLILATKEIKAFRLSDISAVHADSGLAMGAMRFRESGGGQRKLAWMDKESVNTLVRKLQAAIHAASMPAPAAPAPNPPQLAPPTPQVDVADQLEKLASLMERGILTPEEFAQQKARLLNG